MSAFDPKRTFVIPRIRSVPVLTNMGLTETIKLERWLVSHVYDDRVPIPD